MSVGGLRLKRFWATLNLGIGEVGVEWTKDTVRGRVYSDPDEPSLNVAELNEVIRYARDKQRLAREGEKPRLAKSYAAIVNWAQDELSDLLMRTDG